MNDQAFCTRNTDCVRSSRSLRTAISYVAFRASEDHGVRNGQTALYWALVNLVESRLVNEAKPEPSERVVTMDDL